MAAFPGTSYLATFVLSLRDKYSQHLSTNSKPHQFNWGKDIAHRKLHLGVATRRDKTASRTRTTTKDGDEKILANPSQNGKPDYQSETINKPDPVFVCRNTGEIRLD
jgi:hypothetical protein